MRAKKAERAKRKAAGCEANEATKEANKEANKSFVHKSRLFCFAQR